MKKVSIIALGTAIIFLLASLVKPTPSPAVSTYPPVNYGAYPPFNRVCTNLEIQQFIDQFMQAIKESERTELKSPGLITCGEEAVPHLVELLNSQDEKILISTALTLEDIGEEAEEATSALIRLLEHPSSHVRFRAALALATIGPAAKDAVPALILLLQDPAGNVRYAAANALAGIGPAAKNAIPELVQAFRDADSGGSSFLEALASLGDDGLSTLIQLLNDSDSNVRAGAAYALGRYALDRTEQNVEPSTEQNVEPSIVVALTEALQDPNDRVCSNAASALGWIGSAAEEAVPDLVEVLQNRESCRSNAEGALAGIDGENAVLPLARLLDNQNRDVQLAAAQALRSISYTLGQNAKAAVPVLINVLQGQDTGLASYAAETLGLIGPDAREAIPALVAALSRQEEHRDADKFTFWFREPIQNSAALALGQMGQAAVSDLSRLLSSPDRSVRVRALLALSQIGSDAQAAVPYLLPLLQNQDEKIQLLAAIALAEVGIEADAVLPILIPALQTNNLEVKSKVASALGSLGSSATPVVPALLRIIGEGGNSRENWAVRNSATQALIKIGVNAVPSLILALDDDHIVVSARSSFALTEIGSDTIPALVLALRDPNLELRRRAAFVLARIGQDAIPVLQLSLQDQDVNARKGAIYALGIINQPSADVISSLNAIVENESNSLDERRVAASTLVLMGQDMSWFFSQYNLVSPQNAACPVEIGSSDAEFDTYTGNCLMAYPEYVDLAGGGGLIRALCNFFGC